MDIKEYTYILAVVECGSISKAAKKLYISQPSLTTYINNLEKRLGFRFFVEGKGRSHLTPEGELYVEYARQIMILNNNLYEQLRDMSNRKRKLVRIGIARTRAGILIPELLPAIKEADPSIQIEISEGNSKQLEEALRLGELNFALLNDSVNLAGLDYETILEEEFLLVAPKKYRLAEQTGVRQGSVYPRVDLRLLAELPFVMLHHGQRLREIADGLFRESGIVPHVVFETENAVTACKLAEAGYACTFILGSYTEHLQGTVELFSVGTPTVKRKLVIAHLRTKTLSAEETTVVDLIKRLV